MGDGHIHRIRVVALIEQSLALALPDPELLRNVGPRTGRLNSRLASLDEQVLDRTTVAALADEPVDWRFKGLPPSWTGRTPRQICADRPALFDDGPTGPVCVLHADALTHNLTTMADWCRDAGSRSRRTARRTWHRSCSPASSTPAHAAITAATVSQVRVCRAFGVRDVILANQLVDPGGLRWLAGELDRDPEFGFVCWVDSVPGVQAMAAELATCATRPVDVCVEVGMASGRTGCRSAAAVDDVARAVVACPYLRLVGVAGYEAALGHDVSVEALSSVTEFLGDMRSAVQRLAFESDEVLVTAGGSTYFDLVADVLAGRVAFRASGADGRFAAVPI